jgi:oxalate decarboxylase
MLKARSSFRTLAKNRTDLAATAHAFKAEDDAMSRTDTQPVPNHPTPTFSNPDLPPEGQVNTKGNPESLRSDGPRNPVIEGQFPSQIDPPATDISTQAFFWSSFNISPKRIQNGGWARELTSEDFAISEEIAGVNMHLSPGGIRELHWHQTAEWAVMTHGKCHTRCGLSRMLQSRGRNKSQICMI